MPRFLQTTHPKLSPPAAPQPPAGPGRPPVSWALDLVATTPRPAPSAAVQPGAAQVAVAPGAPVASNAGLPAGHGFDGRIASQTLAALRRAGGVSAVYVSPANGQREVAVLATPGFDPARPYQVLVYARGIEGDNAKSLEGQFLAETLRGLNEAGRNVLLVLPKSPTQMHAWFTGAESLGELLPEALGQFRALSGLPLGEPAERWLMAHSGGGKAVQNALTRADAPRFDKLLLADSTYGTWAAGTLTALRRQPGIQLATVVTEHNAARAREQLGSQGLRVDLMPTYPQPGHNGVPAFMLKEFLGVSPTRPFSVVR